MHAPTFKKWHKKKKKKKTLHILTHGTILGCRLTSLIFYINDKKIHVIRGKNVTIRSEIWTTNIRSLGFRDIREGSDITGVGITEFKVYMCIADLIQRTAFQFRTWTLRSRAYAKLFSKSLELRGLVGSKGVVDWLLETPYPCRNNGGWIRRLIFSNNIPIWVLQIILNVLCDFNTPHQLTWTFCVHMYIEPRSFKPPPPSLSLLGDSNA